MKRTIRTFLRLLGLALKAAAGLICLAAAVCLVAQLAFGSGVIRSGSASASVKYAITERYDMYITNTLSEVLEGVLSIKKVYWLSDDDLVAPEPDQSCFGTASSPAELAWLLEDAKDLLDGQDTLFGPDTPVWEGSQIRYYYDETILVLSWKQVMDGAVYTVSEVKIADPSQFRRFLADGQYASGAKYLPTELATSVNAVLAANGDFYTFRDMGIIVYNSQLMRMEGYSMDSCFICGNGDLKFAHTGQMVDRESTQQFLEENGVRFSLAFGPILIENGEKVPVKDPYPVGEGNICYARAALCQTDELHYLVVMVNAEGEYTTTHTIPVFQENLAKLGGIQQAYNLDGGQSATTVMNDETVNLVWERQMSDIIYFATAIPDGE